LTFKIKNKFDKHYHGHLCNHVALVITFKMYFLKLTIIFIMMVNYQCITGSYHLTYLRTPDHTLNCQIISHFKMTFACSILFHQGSVSLWYNFAWSSYIILTKGHLEWWLHQLDTSGILLDTHDSPNEL